MISGARHMRPLNEKCLFPSSSSALLAHVRQCMEGGRERERERVCKVMKKMIFWSKRRVRTSLLPHDEEKREVVNRM